MFTNVTLLVWWLFQQGQELVTVITRPATAPAQGQATGSDILASTESGSFTGVMIVSVFALLGAIHLWGRANVLRAARVRLIVLLFSAYVLWALLSILWSVDAGLSIRRFLQLCLVGLGSLGLGLGFYGQSVAGQRRFLTHVVIAGGISMAVLWIAMAARGTADVFDPAWGGAKEFGISTPIIYPIAFASFALVVTSFAGGHVWLRRCGILLCLFSLFVIKARFIAAFTLLTVVALPLFETRASWRRGLPYVIVGGLVAYALLGLAAFGGQPALEDLGARLWAYGTLGGVNNVDTLTGRTPLWDELLRYAVERPWTGYGFGAFWNPVMMPAIWSAAGWEAPVAHNGFLDEVLATGAIGLVLFLSVWLTGLGLAMRRWLSAGDSFAVWVVAAMVFFLLCNLGDSLMQTYARFPFWISLTSAFALLGAVARRS